MLDLIPGLQEFKTPPLGLRPRSVVATQRIEEIDAAIERYKTAGKEVPRDWWAERDELLRWLVKHRPAQICVHSLYAQVAGGEPSRPGSRT